MKKERIAVFPGSFDPLTHGHVDIVERALKLIDTVVVAVVEQTNKAGCVFTIEERTNMIAEHFKNYQNRVRVRSFSGLLVDFVKEVGGQVIIRGLRAISDFDYEAQMALMNRQLSGGIDTMFLMAREQNSYISSSFVRQVAPYHGNISNVVPPVIAEAVYKKFNYK